MKRLLLSSLLCVGACGAIDSFREVGSPVVTGDTQRVIVEGKGGGFVAPLPDGAACDPGKFRYDVDIRSGVWSAQRCVYDGTAATVAAKYTPKTSVRTLSAGELSMVKTAAEAIVVSDEKTCGADKSTVELTTVSSAATILYGDDFYGCEITDKPLVRSTQLEAFVQVVLTLPL